MSPEASLILMALFHHVVPGCGFLFPPRQADAPARVRRSASDLVLAHRASLTY